jgi:hypothetical protein
MTMSVLANAVKAMLRDGVEHAVIVEFIATNDPAMVAKRKAADRQARYAARRKSQGNLGPDRDLLTSVTSETSGMSDAAFADVSDVSDTEETDENDVSDVSKSGDGSLDKERSPRPPKEIKPSNLPIDAREGADPVEPKPTKREQGHRLPDDWTPTRFSVGTAAREIADRRGRMWGRDELEMFRAHFAASAERNAYKISWQAAWIKWVITADKRDRDNGGSSRTGGGKGGGRIDGFAAALREAGSEAADPHADE